MSEPQLTTIRQLELMRDLQRLANERYSEEQRIAGARQQALAQVEADFAAEAQRLAEQYEAQRAEAEAELSQVQSETRAEYESARSRIQAEYQGIRSGVEGEHTAATRTALEEQLEMSWETWTLYDAIKDKPRARLAETVERLRRCGGQLAVLERDAATIMRNRRQWRAVANLGNTAKDSAERAIEVSNEASNNGTGRAPTADEAEAAVEHVERLTARTREATLALYRQRLPQLFESWYPLGCFLALAAVLCVAAGLALAWQGWLWMVLGIGGAAIVTSVAWVWLYPLARRRSVAQFEAIHTLLKQARSAQGYALEQARHRGQQEAEAVVRQREQQLAEAHGKFEAIVGAKEEWKSAQLGQAHAQFPSRLAALREDCQRRVEDAEREYRQAMAEITSSRDQRLARADAERDQRTRQANDDFARQWQTMADRWQQGVAQIFSTWSEMRACSDRLFPDWNTTDYADWTRPAGVPESIRFGQVELRLSSIKHGLPADQRLRPQQTSITLPTLITLDEHPVLAIDTEADGRAGAVDVLELVMLRLLTAMPPGKVRFTILDPVGLGENFASFMHLADFDEQLVASRIWTESKQIEEQLARLTAHMETVLQKYLRNEFATIHEYNERAGEVAEPFQILVVANFPAGFTEAAARRLVSIATSGPRCGVYTLVSIDRRQRLPNEFRIDDLLAEAVHLSWQTEAKKFVWRYPAYERFDIELDAPPTDSRMIEVIRAAGREAKDAVRVEVPFSLIVPPDDQRWTESSGKELIVPIGRAGATRLQSVRLGKGTAQHLLVCGKTGSGKSTFLHALIVSTALRYGPDEVEFYLIDFKKGVEFKPYATGHLPHARVIAIESEREFGLSVLERLDEELRRRGDWFRRLGVQDLASFREARPDEPMPRVLLIIDEFQELFVEDDKLAQDASLLLDRLVRQGRAFGMHVLLGSQTLGGAYSLARSTMGQMAVRVALQCSEADAHLILNDERNSAARYLNRPGEAIYNDQNGLLAGNHPFQVVWLSEAERLARLGEINAVCQARDCDAPPPIVFEGNVPADPQENSLLAAALASPAPTSPGAPQKAWLGAAVAIKDPTYATFSRHAGSNLLVVGQQEEAAIGVVTTAVISLAAQQCGMRSADASIPHSPFHTPHSFVILDGTRPESPELGTWQRVADCLTAARVVGQREAAGAIGEIAAEVARRESADQEQAPPLYLVIHNAGRFRELRRTDDDFSFSVDRDKPPSPDKQLAEILRNGPAWGVHTIIWCDSYNNVARMFDRSTLREFEMRVLFQMSAADSSQLLDTPAASRLNVHRGLFYSDEQGTYEKFRPYGPPTDDWLAEVREMLQPENPTPP